MTTLGLWLLWNILFNYVACVLTGPVRACVLSCVRAWRLCGPLGSGREIIPGCVRVHAWLQGFAPPPAALGASAPAAPGETAPLVVMHTGGDEDDEDDDEYEGGGADRRTGNEPSYCGKCECPPPRAHARRAAGEWGRDARRRGRGRRQGIEARARTPLSCVQEVCARGACVRACVRAHVGACPRVRPRVPPPTDGPPLPLGGAVRWLL